MVYLLSVSISLSTLILTKAKNITLMIGGEFMLRKCPDCGKTLMYLDNEKNDLTFLICPKCRTVFDDERYVTVDQRISQGYSRYERAEESIANWFWENFIKDDE